MFYKKTMFVFKEIQIPDNEWVIQSISNFYE